MWAAVTVEFYKLGGTGSKFSIQSCFLIYEKYCHAFCAQKYENDLEYAQNLTGKGKEEQTSLKLNFLSWFKKLFIF